MHILSCLPSKIFTALSYLLSLYLAITNTIIANHLSNTTREIIKPDFRNNTHYFYPRSDGFKVEHEWNISSPYGPSHVITIYPQDINQAKNCSPSLKCTDPFHSCRSIDNQHKCIDYTNGEIFDSSCCKNDLDQIKMSENERKTIYSVCENNWRNKIYNCNLRKNILPPDEKKIPFIEDLYLNSPYNSSTTLEVDIKFENIESGSLGVGFWNTSVWHDDQEYTWFMNLNGTDSKGKEYFLNGFYVMSMSKTSNAKTKERSYKYKRKLRKGLPNISIKKLKPLDEEWHNYKIVWNNKKIDFFLDKNLVHTETKVIPKGNMAIHLWMDNAVYDYGNKRNKISNQVFNEKKVINIANMKITK